MRCTNCGSLAIDFADSQAVCSACGVVLEESQIVSDITFAENTAGGAVVQGSYLGADQVRARTSGPGFRGSSAGESRECTIANARWNINRMATARGVPAHVAERALRFFQLALDGGATTAAGAQPKNFVLGRKSDYTVASCLYVACRMAKTTHMLIDFADVIQVNVFVLGRSYLRLLRVLNLQMPLIDPSFYISRFAALLEFGDETQRVVTDATRLVTRFKMDWMVEGRRPAGICGACLLLAARMNHFRRSVTEIVQVVKIADVTLRKRLEEFKSTPSGQLTIEDFRSVWLEEEHNPPAFSRARIPKKDVRTVDSGPPAQPEEPLRSDIDQLADQATEQEINSYLQQEDVQALDHDLAKQERQRAERAKLKHAVETSAATAEAPRSNEELTDLDEAELDSFILTDEEVKIKERVWMEFNKDYLEAGSTAPTSSAAESAKQMMQQKRWSRRINYDVLNSLFPSNKDKESGVATASDTAPSDLPAEEEDEDEDEEEDDNDDDDEEGHATKRARSTNDWMRLSGLASHAGDEEDHLDDAAAYADDNNDAW